MATTSYKNLELQVTGTNNGTWGDVNNDDVLAVLDNYLGAVTSKSLSSSNVTLSATEAQCAILRLTGTLSANVQVTTSALGFFFVENLTSGSFTVTVTNGAASGVVIPQGSRTPVLSDSTNDCRMADSGAFASGTKMLFAQTSAPTGWTKSSSYNDYAVRVVTGSASTGGSTAFTSVFTSRTISQANLPNVNFTGTAASNGAHTHTYSRAEPIGAGGAAGSGIFATYSSQLTDSQGAHTHTVSVASGGSGTGLDFAVSYLDVILATKD